VDVRTRDLLSGVLIGWGVVLGVLAPLLVYAFIHGDDARYVWIINGPQPFDSFGGGPYQLWLGLSLVVGGAFFVTAGGLLREGLTLPAVLLAVIAPIPAVAMLAPAFG
jgi:hypothetical protein